MLRPLEPTRGILRRKHWKDEVSPTMNNPQPENASLRASALIFAFALAACGGAADARLTGGNTDPEGSGASNGGGADAGGAGGGGGGGGNETGTGNTGGGGVGGGKIATVDVEGGPVAIGYVGGLDPERVTIEGYRISKHPITVAEYTACVDRGPCEAPEFRDQYCEDDLANANVCQATNSYTFGASGNLPVTCAKPEQMVLFCEWAAGHLATIGEWLLAARGEPVSRYPWSPDAAPDSTQHPGADPFNCVDATSYEVGKHPAGAGPSGMEDVLLTVAEFAGAEPVANVYSRDRFVLQNARGNEPWGGIDAVQPWEIGWEIPGGAPPAFGFRCTWRD